MKHIKKSILTLCLGLAIVLMGGLFSFSPSGSLIQGISSTSYYPNYVTIYPISTGKVDTVIGGATDTFKLAYSGNPKSLTFSNDAWKTVGSPTLTVACYASSNGGATYAQSPLTTYTVTPTAVYSASTFDYAALTNNYIVNNPYGGNPYTNYMWVATNTASGTGNTASWRGTVTPRS